MSIQPRRLTVACCAALLAGACAAPAAQVAPTNPSPRALAPRQAAEVQVFVGRRPVDSHVDVAIIQPPQVGAYGARLSEVVETVRLEAARIGCDGVVVEGGDRVWGACIVFTAAPSVAPSVAAAPVVASPTAPVVVTPPEPRTTVAARPPVPAVPPPRPTPPSVALERVFSKLDKDGNGRLGPGELPSSAALVEAIDTNNDGWVTRYELRTYNAALAKRS
jgi:hypothetical protein